MQPTIEILCGPFTGNIWFCRYAASTLLKSLLQRSQKIKPPQIDASDSNRNTTCNNRGILLSLLLLLCVSAQIRRNQQNKIKAKFLLLRHPPEKLGRMWTVRSKSRNTVPFGSKYCGRNFPFRFLHHNAKSLRMFQTILVPPHRDLQSQGASHEGKKASLSCVLVVAHAHHTYFCHFESSETVKKFLSRKIKDQNKTKAQMRGKEDRGCGSEIFIFFVFVVV